MITRVTQFVIVFVIGCVTSWFTCLRVNTLSVEQKQFCSELIDAQYEALKQADVVMNNNYLWDKDGSDDMEDYLRLAKKVDSLWMTTL